MKTFKLENEPKIKSGFTIPDNYFENFSTNVLQQLPKNEPKIFSIFSRTKTWIYAAAAVMILTLSVPVYNNYQANSSEIDTTSLENYIANNSSVSDMDLLNLLDEKDIQKISTDLNIEDKSIEDELSSNRNLEQYLLN